MGKYQQGIYKEFLRHLNHPCSGNPWSNPAEWRRGAKITKYYVRTLRGKSMTRLHEPTP